MMENIIFLAANLVGLSFCLISNVSFIVFEALIFDTFEGTRKAVLYLIVAEVSAFSVHDRFWQELVYQEVRSIIFRFSISLGRERWIIRNETCTGSSSLKSVPQFARPRISWHNWWVAIVMQRLKVQVFRKVLYIYIYKIRSSRFEVSKCIWSKHFKWWLQEIALQSFRLQYVFRTHPCVFQTFRLKVSAKSFHCLDPKFGPNTRWTR